MRQFVRQNAVTASMPRQKENGPSGDPAADDRIGRSAKRRHDHVLRGFRERVDLIKAASADDADGWLHGAQQYGRAMHLETAKWAV